jgi:hypothetical protein
MSFAAACGLTAVLLLGAFSEKPRSPLRAPEIVTVGKV